MDVSNFCILVLVLSVLIGFYNALKKKWCKSKVCLVGKTAIVTGANTGIGYETALEFAKRGARVILACRDLDKANQAKDKIITQTKNQNVEVKNLNLASMQSIQDFVKKIKDNERRLDILVNNAGVGLIKNKISNDGLVLQMQINYFGPVLLTIELLDLIMMTPSSRIINVSSVMAHLANLTKENFNKPTKNAYSKSKLGNILFTKKLAQLLKNTSVTVYSLHPGSIDTDIWRNFKGWKRHLINFIKSLYFKTAEEGAQTTLYTALEQGIEKYSGEHFEECQKIPSYKKARDSKLMEEIWEETIKILGCESKLEALFSSFTNT